MSLNTQGIVIREQTLKENDRIISVLTKNHGVIKAYVFGAKKIQSKMSASTQLFAFSDFGFNNKNGFYTVEHAMPKEMFFELRNDIESLSLAQYFAQLEEEFAPSSENGEEFLRLMLNCLHILCKKKRSLSQLKSVFELRILCLSGYMPDIMMCKKCGKYEDSTMFFNKTDTTLCCKDCYEGNGVALDIGVVQAMRHICYSDHEKIFNFTLSDDGFKTLSKITEEYLILKTKRTFKTLDFYNSIKQ